MVVSVMKNMMSSRGGVSVYRYTGCYTKGTPKAEATIAGVMTYSSPLIQLLTYSMLESSEWAERFEENSLIKVARGGCSTYKSGNQPLHSKFLRISRFNSSSMTLHLAQTNLKMLNFLQVSWFFSIRNLSLSKARVEGVVVFFALVFLTMMLRVGKERQKQKTKKKNQGQTALERVRAQKSQ